VAVKLRLMRMGKKKQPTYRVVAADVRSPRDGRFIEIVGIYDPRREPSDIRIDNDKAVAWLSKGAQPTDTVRKLLKVSGAWEQYEVDRPAKPAKPAKASKARAGSAAKKAAKASKATKAAKASKSTKKAAKASS
jgi:small subunit ribosomal protein S16